MSANDANSVEDRYARYLTEFQRREILEPRSFLCLCLRWFGYLLTERGYKVTNFYGREEYYVQFRTASMCIEICHIEGSHHLPSILVCPQEGGKSLGGISLKKWESLAMETMPQARIVQAYWDELSKLDLYCPDKKTKLALEKLVSEKHKEAVGAKLALDSTIVRLCLDEFDQSQKT